MNINMPKMAEKIIDRLYESGFEGFIVGGCVRDSLMNITPHDFDICTSAKPEQVIEMFEGEFKVIPTGLKHGTVTILGDDKEPYEVTTYRIEGEYENHRRPENVEFTSSLREDVKRRDFTMNSIAYNHKVGLVDYFNGIDDIENKKIKSVGDPNERFNEDALRILRGFRFQARFRDFNMSDDVIEASRNLAYLLRDISVERKREELNNILLTNPYVIDDLIDLGIMKYIIEELESMKGCIQNNPYHVYDVWGHTLKAVDSSEKDIDVRLALMLHDIGKPLCKTTDAKGIDHFYRHGEASHRLCEKILKRLKYDNKTVEKVATLVKYHDCYMESDKSIKKMLNKIGAENFFDLLKVKFGDMSGQNPKYFNEREVALKKLKNRAEEILSENECFSLKDLKINGKDLIALGALNGKQIGEILNSLLDMVIEDSSLNNREKLIEISKKKIQRQ